MTKYVLPNGLTVVLQDIPTAVSISVGLSIKTGSRHEEHDQYGYAHFVEHMLFKGTPTYSAKELARQIDRIGGQHNAATNREYTMYYINVIAEHLDLSLKILADTFYNSEFADVEVAKEKEVILEEIRMYEDAPDEHIHDVFMESMLLDHPLGHQILGGYESIQDVTRESVVRFYDTHYRTDNSLLVIVGRVEENSARLLIERYFSQKKGGVVVLSPETPYRERIYRNHIERDLEQVHFCLGLDGFSKVSDKRWALYLISTILGGSASSRLFQKIREVEGLCYSVYSFHSSYRELGVFGIYCSTSPDKYRKAYDLIIEECRLLLEKGISEEELLDAKTFMKGNLALSLENNEVRMSQIARDEIMYDRYMDFDEVIERIDAVSVDDFNKTVGDLFNGKRCSLITIGNLDFTDEEIYIKR